MSTKIYVHARTVLDNRRKGTNDPPIVVESKGGRELAHGVEVVVDGEVVGRFVYDPSSDSPRVWFETAKGAECRPV